MVGVGRCCAARDARVGTGDRGVLEPVGIGVGVKGLGFFLEFALRRRFLPVVQAAARDLFVVASLRGLGEVGTLDLDKLVVGERLVVFPEIVKIDLHRAPIARYAQKRSKAVVS